jgi:hypothetical protein
MAFEEISAVVPWIESCLDIGIDPDAEQRWSPRAFKAHLEWERIPKGGRYITALRDPKSVLPSFYRFFEGWFFEPTPSAWTRSLGNGSWAGLRPGATGITCAVGGPSPTGTMSWS